MIINDIYVDEITLSKTVGISLSEIHSSILSAYKSNSNNWLIDDSIYIECPLYIRFESMPLIIQQHLIEKQPNKKFPFKDGDLVSADHKQIELILRLKWMYESFLAQSNVDITITEKSCDKNEAIAKNAIYMLFNFINLLECGEQVKLNQIFSSMISLGIPGFSNQKYLYRKYKEFKDHGLTPEVFFNKSRCKPRNYLVKVEELHKLKINELRKTKCSSQEISEELKGFCENNGIPTISRSSVKKILADVYDKNRYSLLTKGHAFIEDNIMGHLDREKPKFKYQVLEADGSRLQIPYKKENDRNWKVGFLNIYVILDIATNKVVGYWYGETETSKVAITAFQNLLLTTKYLPTYLKLDRSSAHTSNEFKRFLSKASLPEYEMQHKFCKSAREKGTVENFFHWFPEKICSRYKDYIGLGLLTKEKKKSPEEQKRILHSKSLLSKNGLINTIPHLIQEWNSRPNSRLKLSPNELEKKLEIGQAKYLKPEQTAFLLWEEIKRSGLFKSRIQIERNNVFFRYRITDNELILKSSQNPNYDYSVYFHPNYPELIYLFKDNQFLTYGHRKDKYLDDPINISDTGFNQMLKEAKENQSLMKFIKQSIKDDINKLREIEFKAIPLNNASGMEPNKQKLDQSEMHFFHKNHKKDIQDERINIDRKGSNVQESGLQFDNYPLHKIKTGKYNNVKIEDHERI